MRNGPSTRTRILEKGVDLLSQVGFSGITIGSLADEMGMSKSGLFGHFRSKDAVQIALLGEAVALAEKHVVTPAMAAAAGLPRLRTLVVNWLGWTTRAGLRGGCPVAAGLFELDDLSGDTRAALVAIEAHWRAILAERTREAIALGDLDGQLDVDQFVWELCGLYLSHHASVRFLRDERADSRAVIAFEALLLRATPRLEETDQGEH